MLNAIQTLDTSALLFIQEHIRCEFLNPIMIFASLICDNGFIWILLTLALVIYKKTRERGGVLTLCLASEFILCDMVLKNIVKRIRPYEVIQNLEILVHPESSFCFPSGHAASSFACAYALSALFGRRGALAYIPAVLIAISRPYVGVHYPSDVICGAILGTLVSAAVCAIYKRTVQKKDEKC